MLDAQGRNIEYLRISITDRCNLRCTYCMPEESCLMPAADILTGEELIRIAGIFAKHCGIKKIKLTGGEPLVRQDCVSLIQGLKHVPGIECVTITTNGVLLKEQLPGLLAAGIDRINVSLDTLSPERFWALTGKAALERVLEGIAAVKACGIPLHINCVAARSGGAELPAIAALAEDKKTAVRFIEMMPIGCGGGVPFYREDELREMLERVYGRLTPCMEAGSGPANYYRIAGFAGKIGFISAMSHRFCGTCNRVRLTADGQLKTCLQYEPELSVRKLLRDGSQDAVIAEALKRVIFEKKDGHHFGAAQTAHRESRNMSQIGG